MRSTAIRDFTGCRYIKVARPVYRAPELARLAALLREAATWEQTDPAGYILFLLICFGGLRAKEARNARLSWLLGSLDRPRLQVTAERGFRPKTGRSRKAPIHRLAFAKLRKLAKDRTLLVATNRAGCEAAYRRTLELLRRHGMDTMKPVKDMRRVYASTQAEKHGHLYAQRTLGHASVDTTYHSYHCYLLLDFTARHVQLLEAFLRGKLGHRSREKNHKARRK